MKCPTCQTSMLKLKEDVDYTRLAGLRGKTVTLTGLTIYQCKHCGPASSYIEYPRLGSLVRELEACRATLAKHVVGRFNGTDWTFAFAFEPLKDRARPRRKPKS